MGKLHGRKRLRFGPIIVNLASSGIGWRISSWTVKVGPLSWNSSSKRARADLPGPYHWTSERTDR